jgi:hypothetical protein
MKFSAWSWYWIAWFFAAFLAFLVPEIIAIVRKNGQTLSQNIWRMEGFLSPGYNIWHWTAIHILFSGALLLTFIWLIGHFVFHIWV